MVMWPSQSQTRILLLWILCAIMYNSTICIWGRKLQCNETDRQKLLSFKHQVIDSSGMLSSWSTKRDCCGWVGVECDHFTHRVTNLSLPCAGFFYFTKTEILHSTDCLTGEFSLFNLLELEYLKYLDLSKNHLSFKTPHCCGNYTSKLVHLDLSFNHLGLKVDDLTWLIHMSSLEYLNLGGISLHSSLWLQSMSTLSSLSELYLNDCQLHDINPSLEFANFTLLQVLDLSDNYFHFNKLSKWLFNLSHVRVLDLSQNHFQGRLPETILNLQKLKTLWLFGNEFDGAIPNWLGQHENLQHLDLSSNLFVGPIPETLGNLSFLIELYLGANLLNGNLPKSLRDLSKLEMLDVQDTFLAGAISENNFSHLTNLEGLSLGSPALTFHFDPHWIPSFQLQLISLEYVHHELPAWLYTQKSLKALYIYNSNLSIEDQDKFWSFVAEVRYLALWNSSISGDLSKVLFNSRAIVLSGNNFIGGLPRISLNVTVLLIEHNYFSGTLTSLLCQKMEGKSNLAFLHITDTHLFGGLTECWMNWKSLVHIRLANNKLTGKIPESMSLLSNLKSLHLDNNNLFGYIPASLQNCQKLSILNLGQNKFSGNIPYWISQSVSVLQLRSNQFSGNIPPKLCQLSSLLVLDIADNRLSGTIPNCFYNITAMISRDTSHLYTVFPIKIYGYSFYFNYYLALVIKGNQLYYPSNQMMVCVLDLSRNNLIGKIPSELFTLNELQSLNLSKNQLTGRIPYEIRNLKQLESLDLSSYQISGEIPLIMSELSFLSSLNLSFNNFTGQIPPMAQFQRFDALCYIGNPGLCGAPLTKICTQEENSNMTKPIEENDDEEFLSWFYIGMGIGFATGFWTVCASLFFNRTWRHAYFKFLDELKNQLQTFFIESQVLLGSSCSCFN